MIVIVNCQQCGKELKRRSDKTGKRIFCGTDCLMGSKKVIVNCFMCKKEIRLTVGKVKEVNCCSRACGGKFNSERFRKRNLAANDFLMSDEIRGKIRESKLGKGEGKSYEKTFGRHTHRIVMEEMIGRKLLPGEVVHHIDEDKRNNNPSNLMLFASQAEHAAHHKLLLKNQQK
ncbi:MAG: HNH endonuclease signature motif containing protein [Chitinophagia bacterium]